jgi:hypothetical protein
MVFPLFFSLRWKGDPTDCKNSGNQKLTKIKKSAASVIRPGQKDINQKLTVFTRLIDERHSSSSIMKILGYLLLIFASVTRAELPASIAEAPDVRSILSRNYIRVEAAGQEKANFAELLRVNGRSDLLQAIQIEYAAMLPEGERPEFAIEEVAPGEYFYLNGKDQESHITELLRDIQPDGKLHAVYRITGERFFGDFKALVHVEISDEKEGMVSYCAEVYAWPESTFFRILARGLHFAVESFFSRKTEYMTGLILNICSRLLNDPYVAAVQMTPVVY